MSYALDLLIALICVLVAALYVIQIKATHVYTRFVGPNGLPIPAEEASRQDPDNPAPDVVVELFTTLSHNPYCAPPAEDGWHRREDQLPTWKNYVHAAFGLVLAVGAVGLVLGAFLPTTPIAWVLASASAIALAVDLPRLLGQLFDRQFFLLMFVPQAIVGLGAFAAYRLL